MITMQDWLHRLDVFCMNFVNMTRDEIPRDWEADFATGLTPLEAFDAWYEGEFGGSWAELNGQFGVGS